MARTNLSMFATPTPAASGSPSERSDEFVAVTGAESEQVSAPLMVVGAYGLFWLLAFGFVYMTYQSQSRLAKRVAELEKKLPKDTQVS